MFDIVNKEYEKEIAIYEAERNHSMDEWFNANQHIDRNKWTESVFEAGFRMAWRKQENS